MAAAGRQTAAQEGIKRLGRFDHAAMLLEKGLTSGVPLNIPDKAAMPPSRASHLSTKPNG